jgi:phage shock protein PspC (stress-responsive transcriptional regulator)
VAAKPLVIEKGYSPYAAYYRSKDSRWGYGIFGGLAHRNGWSGSTLFQVRFFTLLFILPALAYVGTWGLFVMLMTPALPTNKVKSYFDVGG